MLPRPSDSAVFPVSETVNALDRMPCCCIIIPSQILENIPHHSFTTVAFVDLFTGLCLHCGLQHGVSVLV